ncbi:DUF3278 domain-containing protein [Lysinibacillus sp. NPDC097214]|uniref:DUF3278 domain-containing protein n=1 Tax=Lysinibacillus sp. NPDC097214 TaxID=3390584 RepID=UPI003CFD7A2B
MKSWISFLIPVDEYKEKKMLYFFSEGGILLFLFLIVMLIGNKFYNFSIDTVLLSSIFVLPIYVLGKYTISGIEYTDTATGQEYKKELRVIVFKTIGFVIIFLSLYLIFIKIPSNPNDWFEPLGISLLSGIGIFFINVISLKRSYTKNKELL